MRLIVQVLINLINNAIKYTEDESTISINAYQIKIMCIFMCDNGSGIKKILIKIKFFEKFYTVNHSVVDSKKSMGLGFVIM